ncbi:DUF975 family protein [Wenyingzhuangia sp. IMCC45533]
MNHIEIIKKSVIDLKGYWSVALLSSLLVSLLPVTIQYHKILGLLLILIFSGPLRAGIFKIALLIVNKKDVHITHVFEGFKFFKNAMGVFLLSLVFIIGGMLLFIIPGIIAMIWLSQSFFILVENPELEPLEVFKMSKNLMRGNEFNFFGLFIVFTLITVLLALSKLVMLAFLVAPIQYVAFANFYQHLKKVSHPT